MHRLAYLVVIVGCATVDGSAADEQDSGVTQYINLADFTGTDQGAWFDGIHRLDDTFAGSCAQTFCTGGRYTNLTPLTFSCAVSTKLGSVKDCAWTFAASASSVDPATAAIATDAPTFECHLHPRTTATKLIAFLGAAADPLHDALPGGGAIADGLADCFQHPIGATPIGEVTARTTTYVAATDYYTSAAGKARWQAALAAAKLGFDNICGDTFCGGDFGDLQSLELVCAITKSTGNVKGCAWVFGGSFAQVSHLGGVVETDRSFRCEVKMKGTVSELIDVLVAPGTDNHIQRPLPGMTTTAYDALGGCLP